MSSPLRDSVVESLTTDNSRQALNRPSMHRIYEIHAAIQSGTYPNCSSLARKIEVTPKTIQRDINHMRDMLGLPIEYDPIQHGYYYTRDTSDFPVFETTADALAGLFLARAALDAVRGTSLENTMGEVFGKLTRSLNNNVSFSWSDLDDAFSRKRTESSPRDLKLFGELADAVLKRKEITFSYRKLGAEQAENRRVRPYHLGEVEGGWYLVGFDPERNALRTFALPRMSRLKTGAKTFERPRDFSGREHLRRSFGVWTVATDRSRHLVRVELRGYAAQLAQERRWHPTQDTVPLNDKGTKVEVRFEVGRLEEVLRWTLSFGRQAKVLGPPELVRMVKDELKAMSAS
jgi:predicted DNA-binding transcriptional regulator YafY